ncbi:Kojibiose phosphorylase [compost metagenome]
MDQELYEKTKEFSGDGTKIIKQCDVIMLMSMLRNDFNTDIKTANFNYFDPRTMHESSLSATHAGIVAADVGNIDLAYQYFLHSSRFNLDFNPKENYNNGLHIASFAGAWLIYLYGFFGIHYDASSLKIKPNLPSQWKFATTNIIWRNYRIKLEATSITLTITMIEGSGVIQMESKGIVKYLSENESLEFEVDDYGITVYSSEEKWG